jgi:hypothetical protein
MGIFETIWPCVAGVAFVCLLAAALGKLFGNEDDDDQLC